jgi:site-specific recombinase xerC
MPRKGENIYKRKDKRWEARYVREYRPDGTPKYGYCYGKTYREAKQKVMQAKADILACRPVPPAPHKRRFAFYCDEWLQLNRSRIKESTYVKYRGMLDKHVKPRLGGYLVQSLSSAVIEQFGHALLYEQSLAPKTVKDILTMLHAIVRYTCKCFSEPLPMVEIVYPKVPKQEMRVLTREEQIRFVQYLLEDMDACKFGTLLALLTGMRIGEICALRWENVSLTEQTIKVNATMQRLRNFDGEAAGKTKVVISEPKSDSSTRIIPLTDYTVKLCNRVWCGNPDAFVLTGETGSYIEPRVMQQHLKKYTAACSLAGVRFHTLRHTFATRCVEVDFEIKSLSEILGHSSPRITLERYVHSSFELKRSNMNKLAAIGY